MSDRRIHATELLDTQCSTPGSSAEELLPVVYTELRQVASALLGKQRAGHTLQPTALVHEAFLRLIDVDRLGARDSDARRHFVALATLAMRRILQNHARDRRAGKRGGDWQRLTLSEEVAVSADSSVDLIDLAAALDDLEAMRPRLAEVASLRLLGGLELSEIAPLVDRSLTRLKDDWKLARAILSQRLEAGSTQGDR